MLVILLSIYDDYFKDRLIVRVKDEHFAKVKTLDVRYDKGVLKRYYQLPLNAKTYGIDRVEGLYWGTLKEWHIKNGLDRWLVIYFQKEVDIPSMISRLQATGLFEVVEPWIIYRINTVPADTPNDPGISSQWHIWKIQAPEGWFLQKAFVGADTIVVAAIDGGVAWDHPDLVNIIWQNLGEDADSDGVTIEWNGFAWVVDSGDINGVDDDGNGYVDDVIGWDFPNDENANPSNNPKPTPCNSFYDDHGTHVGGIMAAHTNNSVGVAGVAWGAKLMAIQAGTCGFITNSYNATNYAASNGAKITNHSYGSSFFSSSMNTLLFTIKLSQNVNNFAAAGNDGSSLDATPQYPCCYNNNRILCVASTNSGDQKSSFSNYGSCVDVSAPGEGIYATAWDSPTDNHTYAAYDGTSMASPVAAGVAAVVKMALGSSSANALDVDNLVMCGADNIDDVNPNYAGQLGSGRVNLFRSVAMAKFAGINILNFVEDDAVNGNGNGRMEVGETVRLYADVINESCFRDASNITLTLINSDPNITVNDNTINIASLTSGSQIQPTDFFEVTISGNQPRFWDFKVAVTSTPNNIYDTLNFRLVIGFPQILVVWDDPNNDFSSYYTSALDALSLIYEKVNSNEPSKFYLNTRNIIIWATGNATDALTPEEVDSLIAFLNSGGLLFISSQYLAEDPDASTFITNYLGANVVQTGISPYVAIVGDSGDAIGDGMRARMFGSSGAENIISLDDIAPLPYAVRSFHFASPVGTNDYGGAMVRYRDPNGNFRTVYASFPFEAIADEHAPDWNTRAEVLDRILNWLQGNVSTSEPIPLNTVNLKLEGGKLILEYNVQFPRSLEVSIYSIDGRKVFSKRYNVSKYGRIVENLNLSRGIYIVDFNGRKRKMLSF